MARKRNTVRTRLMQICEIGLHVILREAKDL